MGARHGGRAAVAARLAATPPISEPDGHALAGLLDAEGTFGITRNNGGRNWLCSAVVSLRADDAALLSRFHELTGLGTVVPTPARRTSRPQARWAITSRLECLHLADLLEMFPIRGRKRFEFGDWAEAVRGLETHGSHADISPLARRIRSRRRYVEPAASLMDPATDEPGLLWYLGGFFTGEGCFVLSQAQARTVIKLRRDDRPLLVALASITGLGRVYDMKAYGRDNPTAAWIVYAQSQLGTAIELLSAARLRGRKRRQFHVWRIGAGEFATAHHEGRPRRRATIEAAVAGLREAGRYRHRRITASPNDEAIKQAVFIEVLRSWARTAGGELTCTEYVRARRQNPTWPTRNTITLAFGSWRDALRVSGLAARASVWRQADFG